MSRHIDPVHHYRCDGEDCDAIVVASRPPKEWRYLRFEDGRHGHACPKCWRRRGAEVGT